MMQSRIAPANPELYRLLLRTSGYSPRRPDPPQEVQYVNGCLRWKEPADRSPVTHYIVRIDSDGSDPSMVVPVGSTWIPIPPGVKAFVSSWNSVTRIESSKAAVDVSGRQQEQDSLKVALPAGVHETEISFADGSEDSLLVVEITQNSTGEGTIVWGDNFDASTPTDLTKVADEVTRFTFWWDSKWKLISRWPVFDYPGSVTIDPLSVNVDEDTDPMKAIITAEADLPEILNDFDGCDAFFKPAGSTHYAEPLGHIPHRVGTAGPFKVHIELFRPITGVTGKIYLVSRNQRVSGKLLTSGVNETPNFQVELTARPPSTIDSATAPTGCSLSIALDGDTFSLETSWTPATPVGGTTKWGREVRYFSDSGCTLPDSDWIALSDVYGENVTDAVSGPFPRPPADQWVKLRVRGINWQDEASAWTVSTPGQKLDKSTNGYEAPNAPTACSVAIVSRGNQFSLQITITPPGTLAGTAGYEREARYYNDSGLTTPDSDWIPLGWVEKTDTVSQTAFWPRPPERQWVKVRVRANNWNGDVTSWVESSAVETAPPAPVVSTVTASAFPNGEEGWGVTWSVSFGAGDRSLIDRLELYIVSDPGGASEWSQLMALPIVPGSGGLSDSTDGRWPRPDATETYRVDAVIVDVYGRSIAPVSSSTFSIGAWAWQQVTWGTPTADYAAVQGQVKVSASITAPDDPELVAVRLYQKRGTGQPQEVGLQPITSNATTTIDFTLELPAGSTQSIDVFAVPVHDNGSADVLRTSGDAAHPKITISADPTQQALESFDGLTSVTLGAATTISRAPGRVGELLVVSIIQDATGGRIPTWSSDFQGTYPAPWPDPTTKTFFTFICMNSGSGNKWHLVAERYNA